MKQNCTNQFRYAVAFLIALFSLTSGSAQTGVYSLNFSAVPTLISGTQDAVGSSYRFSNVSNGMSAIVTIVGATGGATVKILDDNNLTKPEAFSPRIAVPPYSTGMVEFSIELVAGSSNNPKKMDTLYATAMDIDGNSSLHEMDAINLGGGNVSYQSTTLEISVTQSMYEFLGRNVGGVEYPEVDTTARAVMFTVTNKDVQTFTYKAGAENLAADTASRQKGIYFKGFTYPSFGVLPVTISRFNGSSRTEGNVLNWETSSEQNTKMFTIEKSIDGQQYQAIGTVAAAGNSNTTRYYTFMDANVKPGYSYYRLRTTDKDGQFNYSASVMLKKENTAAQVSLFPCPVADFTIVSISTTKAETITLRMLDANGKVLYSRPEKVSKGTTQIRLGQLDKYPGGSYYLQVVQEDKTITKPFIIL